MPLFYVKLDLRFIMPKAIIEVPETTESISLPIASAISKQLVQKFGLDENVRVVMPFEDLGISNQNSTMHEGIQVPNRINTQVQMEVVWEEDYTDANQLTRAYVNHEENKSIFVDDDLKIYLFTNYQQIKGTLRCILRSTDFTQAQRIVKAIKNRVEREFIGNVHQVSYHYPIPLECMYMICEMYNMRERNFPLGGTLGGYLRDRFVKNVTTITSPGGTNTTFVVAENQIAITGQFDFGMIPPKPNKVDGAGAYTLEFTYEYLYDRCDDIVIDYPLMVHNQHIPSWMYDNTVPYEINNYLTRSNFSTNNMNELFDYKVGLPNPDDIRPGLPIPYYDTWYTPDTGIKYTDVMRVLCSVNMEDPRYIGNISEIGDWFYRKNALRYMKEFSNKLLRIYDNVFLVRLFEFNGLLDNRQCQLNSDMILRYLPGLDPKKVYHMSVGLLSDPTLLSEEGLRDLGKHGHFLLDYLNVLFPPNKDGSTNNKRPKPSLNPDGSINWNEFVDFLDGIYKDGNREQYDFVKTLGPVPPQLLNRATITGRKEKL